MNSSLRTIGTISRDSVQYTIIKQHVRWVSMSF